MTPQENREDWIVRQALERPPARRADFLDGACAGDVALRQRVEALLAAQTEGGGFAGPTVTDPQAQGLRAEPFAEEGPGTVIGRYKLLEQIGEGGFGVVYVAEQQEPVRRQVALKIIKLGMDTRQVVARFEAERQALALMDHPSIAKVFDAGATDSGRPFFVMELVKGIPITKYCDQEKLGTRNRLDLFIGVCQAIQHAHQKGIIHRDIKPSNILVTVQEGKPVPKVIDFGIAKATQQRLTEKTLHTQLDQFIGTPAYMSPEQAEMSGLDIDTRSDIYSLGVLLYELLVGKTPFDWKDFLAAGLDEIRRTIREKEPTRPSTRLRLMGQDELTTTTQRQGAEAPKLISLLQGDLDSIVMKCLEKDRTRRYDTANGLAMDLQRHLDNEPVVARPPSTAYRLQKAWRRNKLVFTAVLVVAAALVAGIGVSSWQAVVAGRARNAEKQQRVAAQAAQKEAERSQHAEKQERQRAERRETEARRLLYVADMNLAQQAWDQSDVGWLGQLLEETQAFPDRGFEWYYWQKQAHLSLKTFRGHTREVTSVAVSPDGQRIVTGSYDNTAKVWDVTSGTELVTIKGHGGPVGSVAFSPEGQRIVTGCALPGPGFNSPQFEFDYTAKVWDASSGKELVTLKGHNAGVSAVAFSPDGQRIVTGSSDSTAKVWDASSGKELVTLKGHREVGSVAFSPDGQRIVTGSWDLTAKVWDTASGKELLTLKGHNAGVSAVAFSPDGQRIVTGSDDRTAKVWEAASGEELLTLKGHSAPIRSVGFSSDSQRIATGSDDRTAKVWDAASGRELVTLMEHRGSISSVAFSPNGQWIVTGSDDWTARVWDATSGRELFTPKKRGLGIRAAAISPDGQRTVTANWDNTAKVSEAASGKELVTLVDRDKGRIESVAFSPDGQRIVTGSTSADSTVKLWAVASGRKLLTLFRQNGGSIVSVAFSPDGQRIASCFYNTAKVWDATSGRELLTLKGHNGAVSSVAFSPDGQRIVTGSGDRTAKVWDAASGRELQTLKGYQERIQSVAFSPDAQRILTGSADAKATVWEAASGRELLTLKGHNGGILSAAFSPDGQRIVTVSSDGTVKLWEAARTEQVAKWQAEEAVRAEQVAKWQAEEATMARMGEMMRQQSSRARDSIKQWLILAPIALASGQSGAEGLEIEQIAGEGQLKPKAGEAMSIGGGELKWREVALTNEVIDFNAILGRNTEWSVAYAVCYIRSKAEQRGLQILVGSDDEAKVYLNGKEVYKSLLTRSLVADQDMVPDITLNAGLNVLVFKVVNEGGPWQGCIRFTDAQGNPVKGIKVTLDPEAKGSP